MKKNKKNLIKNLLIDDLEKLGVSSGDTVLVHSSYKSLGLSEGNPALVVEALKEALSDGTLLLPALSYENVTKTNPRFSVLETPSCVGVIPETFRKSEGVYRSVHPTHSVCAWGKLAKEYTESHYKDKTPVGPNSPFTLLAEQRGKLLMLGCGLEPNTLIHGVEEKIGTPYVLSKETTNFQIVYSDGRQEETEHITHNFFNENGEHVDQRYDRILQVLPIKGGMVAGAVAYLLDAKAVWEMAARKISLDPWFFVDK